MTGEAQIRRRVPTLVFTAPPLAVRVVAAALLLGAGRDAVAQQRAADKSGYHLFNPTPRHLMRDLSADRPDVTESPITVDAGHVQVELSFLDYRRDDRNSDNTEFEAWTVGATNIKFGLLNNVDLQFVFDAYTDEDTLDKAAGTASSAKGFNDIQFRLKINLWGNDGGETAFAVMPFIQLPAGSDELSSDHVEGGLIFPFATELSDGWGLGLMAEVDWVFDEDDGEYDTEFVHTAVLGHDIMGSLGGYVEYIGIVSGDGDSDYQALIGTGLTYALSADLVLDIGANFGLTKTAEDVNVFAGVTVRF
ncbi:MAG: transporter [Planctomycetes bacterium]|nr:transporter [Planctomycetota bacterium]